MQKRYICIYIYIYRQTYIERKDRWIHRYRGDRETERRLGEGGGGGVWAEGILVIL
jgi:hypothetical protein